MLEIIRVKSIIENLELVNKNSIVNQISDGSKISKTKFPVDFKAKLSQSKNKVWPNLAIFSF